MNAGQQSMGISLNRTVQQRDIVQSLALYKSPLNLNEMQEG